MYSRKIMDDIENLNEISEKSLKLSSICEETKQTGEAENAKTAENEVKQIEENVPIKNFANSDMKPAFVSKHKSDIFFLEADKQTKELSTSQQEMCKPQTPRRINKLRDHTSTIFPVGCMGCREDPPSDHAVSPRRFLDASEAKDYIGHIDNTPRKRPLSAKPHNTRNPLTGVGVNTGETRRHSSRRKDGNPLLGEGYNNKNVTSSSTRIPPGGYSQGLW